jgi:hypothetical protein
LLHRLIVSKLTTTNIITSGLLGDQGLAGFGVLDFAPLGVFVVLAEEVYVIVVKMSHSEPNLIVLAEGMRRWKTSSARAWQASGNMLVTVLLAILFGDYVGEIMLGGAGAQALLASLVILTVLLSQMMHGAAMAEVVIFLLPIFWPLTPVPR